MPPKTGNLWKVLIFQTVTKRRIVRLNRGALKNFLFFRQGGLTPFVRYVRKSTLGEC